MNLSFICDFSYRAVLIIVLFNRIDRLSCINIRLIIIIIIIITIIIIIIIIMCYCVEERVGAAGRRGGGAANNSVGVFNKKHAV